jgi:cytosine/uracil/thiamine/allantoin permease
MSKILKIILINIGLFAILEPLSILGAFLAGYAASGQEAATWKLFIGFIIFHLGINFFILKRMKALYIIYVIISILEIFILYGIVAWTFRFH